MHTFADPPGRKRKEIVDPRKTDMDARGMPDSLPELGVAVTGFENVG
jgi:hypothetical protein